ncbi:VAMP5 protein, partial [Smithornis capensis]|nr:VAMP5 protein [Smithornis capensis]
SSRSPHAPSSGSPCSHSPLSSMVPCPRCSSRVPIVLSPHGPRVPLSPREPTSPVSSQRVPTVSPHVRVPPCPQAGLARCQREAEEVTELMRQNVARALEREGHLEQLQSRAQDLRHSSEAFRRSTRRVTQQQRRGQRRWRLVALGLGLFLLLLLGLGLALALGLARTPPGTSTVTVTVPAPRGWTEPLPAPRGPH